ncbi:MarR family winged helix-turn-helix transcriptional regulator [Sphingomonas sp. J344]|uniref:MarR family winged helix-turn-helix transcriptional regulator n=1 Tax=Sphingomonas sp. J344 TaxID=2898434 RepID=UPI0027E36AB5|nr:MarR family winged helix-turn-helix transcriptional regulator [Sphingomonas sp. J344]
MTATLKLDAFLPYRLSVASNRVSGTIAGAYQARFGLRIPEWRLVTVLAEFGSMSQQALCGRTQMDKVTVSRAAISLHERGLVTRTPQSGRPALASARPEPRGVGALPSDRTPGAGVRTPHLRQPQR